MVELGVPGGLLHASVAHSVVDLGAGLEDLRVLSLLLLLVLLLGGDTLGLVPLVAAGVRFSCGLSLLWGKGWARL